MGSSSSSSSSSSSRGSSSTLSRGGSSSSSSWSTSSSSYSRGTGGGQAQGQMFFGRNSPISSGPLFSSVNTTFGQTPIVYERRYEYSQSSHNRGRHSVNSIRSTQRLTVSCQIKLYSI